MSFNRDFVISTPIDHTLNSSWPDYDRRAKQDVQDRLKDIISGFNSGETVKGVLNLPFIAQATPSTVTDQIQLYGKVVAGKTELHFLDEDGNECQMTSGGKLLGVPSGGIIFWSGSIVSIPSGWYLCNGSNGTPDLRDKFIVGAGSTYAVAATGGAATKDISHTHAFSATTGVESGHTDVPSSPDQVGVAEQNHTHSVTGTTGSGGSATQDILPPYYALAYIMRA